MNNNYQELGINIRAKRTRRFLDAGLINDIDESFVEEVQTYWQTYYNKKIDPSIHIAFSKITGKKEPRVIPGREMADEIIKYLNDGKMSRMYRDKNIYDILINTRNSVKSIIKRIRGNYYDSENNPIKRSAVWDVILNTELEYIIKPSDSNNGFGIEKLTVNNRNVFLNDKKVTLEDIEEMYQFNFTIQKFIEQHPIMAAPHPSSVNTLRMVTLRWKGEIKYLLTFARFGTDGSVKDNAGAGGVCVGVKDSGEFLDIAIDEDCKTHSHHPTTNFKFTDLGKIPNFDNFKEFVIDAHKSILHHDFVSWDIAVGIDGEPIFIEANFAGATWLYQIASQKPLFGELTEEILQHTRLQLDKQVSRDIVNRANLSIKQKNIKLNQKIKKNKKKINLLQMEKENLLKENQNLQKELKKKEDELKKIKNSRSWKYTSFLRKK